MDIKMFDVVKLKDGREGTIVEVYDNGKAFEIEIMISGQEEEYPEFELYTIKADEIKKVIEKSE